MDGIYDFKTPVYRSIPDLLQTDREELSFREKHRVRIFEQFEPITEADLNPVQSLPCVDAACQTTPLPDIPKTQKEPTETQSQEQSLTWQWPKLRSNDTYRVVKKMRDAQASNTYGFAYYKDLATEELSRAPTTVKQKPRTSKRGGARLVPLENASCGIAMEVANANSKTNWEALMNHINESIRDTQQQRMIGQYMIEKLKKEQNLANIPAEQAAANKRCLEELINRYGTGLEGIVSKEKEFERLIEAYQIFMRGDKKKVQKKLDKRPAASTRKLKLEEPLPAIGDQRAGRSQVGCKIRQSLRREYGERVRQDFANKSSLKKVVPTVPGAAAKPMQVKVRKSVISGQPEPADLAVSEEMDLPSTPVSPVKDSGEFVQDHYQEETKFLDETESQLSLTYVPSETQSVAQLIPDVEDAVTVEIIQEEQEQDEEALALEQEPVMPKEQDEGVLMLEGDTDSNILVVDSTTDLDSVPSKPAKSPKFQILEQESLENKSEEKPEQDEPVVIKTVAEAPAKEASLPKTPVSVSLPKTPAELSLPKTPAELSLPKTPAEVSLPKTPAESSLLKTPAESSLPKTPAESSLLKTPAESSLPKTPAELSLPKTPAESSLPKTPAESSLPKTPTEEVSPLKTPAEDISLPKTPADVATPTESEKAEGLDRVDSQVLKLVAVGLVNDVIERIDSEVESTADDEECNMEPRTKSIHFKSSPEIMYYEKTSPEAELAADPDERAIIAEDLSEADQELDDEAKALYHKVLSNLDQDQVKEKTQTDSEVKQSTEQEDTIQQMTRELTNDALKKNMPVTPEKMVKTEDDTKTAADPEESQDIAEQTLKKSHSPEITKSLEAPEQTIEVPAAQTPDSIVSETARELTATILNNIMSDKESDS